MTSLNIVVTRKLETGLLQQIAALDPSVTVLDGADFNAAELNSDFSYKDKLDNLLAKAQILLCDWPPKNIVSRAPNLKWIQSMLAGVDVTRYADVFQSPVILTNSRGIHGPQMSEITFEMILMLAKQANKVFENKQQKKYDRFMPMVLQSKTIGIIGLGSIGQEIARIAKAFRMTVVACPEIQ